MSTFLSKSRNSSLVKKFSANTYILEGDTFTTMEAKVDLVPEEGFVEDTNKDNSKRFTCKQCDKGFKTAHSAKQHIVKMHKNKAMKRTASKSENSGRKGNMKRF